MRTSALILLSLAAAVAACAVPVEFDLVIRGGTVYDGRGAAGPGPRVPDVGIRGDRITAVGDLAGRRISRVIDATGLAVAPGFVDADAGSGLSLLLDGAAESHVRQGVTTVVVGADDMPGYWTAAGADRRALARYGLAFDWTTAAGFGATLAARGTAVNVAALMPAAALRAEVIGARVSEASGAELAAMAARVESEMAAGVFGLGGRLGIPPDGLYVGELAALGQERGLLRDGFYADVVVFDPAAVRPADAASATPYPTGIAYVVVNGVVTVTPAGHAGSRAGRWLAGPGTTDAP